MFYFKNTPARRGQSGKKIVFLSSFDHDCAHGWVVFRQRLIDWYGNQIKYLWKNAGVNAVNGAVNRIVNYDQKK